MLIYHCVPKAARRFIIKKLLAEFPRMYSYEYYEPMRIFAGRQNPDELGILFDPAQEMLRRFDFKRLKSIDFSFGVFSADRYRRERDDFSFTFIRHPVERFYSGYYHAHNHLMKRTEKSQDGSRMVRYRERFPEMVELFCSDLKTYVRRFLDSGGKIRFDRPGTVYGPIDEIFFLPKNLHEHDFVGVVELMDESLEILNRRLGTKIKNDGRVNEGPARPAKRYGVKALTEFFAEDIEKFNAYKAKIKG
ncbi:MAG TPA: sulfotransferase family 2 domain-containing protein [Pyrinomonadaceae bacterium]|jgi:hypothetical protein|nr:sulfotransferase family 2 domain-containing protein [Pyrinomonadaceae bacterium]